MRPWVGLLLAGLLCVVLRLPSFRSSILSDDEAIYDAMARVVAAGGVMYRDAVDHKPPGLTYTYAAARRLACLIDPAGRHAMDVTHLLGMLAVLGTCAGLYGVARRLLRPDLAGVPPLLYALVSAAKQPADGLAVNGELLMNLPTILSVLAVLCAQRERGFLRVLLDLSAGALCGVAVLYKYQAGIFGLAFVFLLPGRPASWRCLGRCLGRGLCWLLGLSAPLLLCAAYFHHRGVLDDALRWGIGFNRQYIHEGPGPLWAMQRFGIQMLGVVLPALPTYVGGLVTLVRLLPLGGARARPNDMPNDRSDDRSDDPRDDVIAERGFLLCWTLVALLSVGLGGRFFGHYFLQPELPLALLAAGPVARAFRHQPLRLAIMGVATVFFFAVATVPALGRLFNPHDADFRAIGDAIAARTAPGDSIWVWGNAPQIYGAADRQPGVRFTFCNYLTGLSPGTPSEYDPRVDPRADAVAWAWPLVFADLDRRRPTLLVDTAAANLKFYGRFPIHSFPDLQRYLDDHYRRDGEVDGALLYRRID